MSNKDQELEALWLEFGNVPVNEDDEIEQAFYIFEKGTDKWYILDYFDEEHSKGIHWLMYGAE